MRIRQRLVVAMVASALAAAWAVPAPAAEVAGTPAEVAATPAEVSVAQPPNVVMRAAPAHKVKKARVVKKFWRYRLLGVVSAGWPVRTSHHYLVLGVAY
jgi:hypothetical protein